MASRNNPYTGLILLTGEDSPGITEALFSSLAQFSISIIDIEQIVIRKRLILTVLISLDRAHASAIESDLEDCGTHLGIEIAIAFSDESSESIAAKTGLLHVTVLGPSLNPEVIAEIAGVLAQNGANIERIFRTA